MLLAGLEVNRTSAVVVLDLVFNRCPDALVVSACLLPRVTSKMVHASNFSLRSTFNELGKAVWLLQKRMLAEPNQQNIDWRFCAVSTRC